MMRFMPANWSPKSWGELHASRVAMEVRRLRGGRSVQWLAERTAELGHPMNRNALTDLENGRRRYVTTAELVVLAAALDTAPATLLFSGPYNAENEVLDGTTATEFEAVQWFSGLSDAPDGIGDPEEYAENTSLLGLARRIADLQQQQIALMRLAEERSVDRRGESHRRTPAANRRPGSRDGRCLARQGEHIPGRLGGVSLLHGRRRRVQVESARWRGVGRRCASGSTAR